MTVRVPGNGHGDRVALIRTQVEGFSLFGLETKRQVLLTNKTAASVATAALACNAREQI